MSEMEAVAVKLDDCIDLERYPIDRLEEEQGRALVETCRRQLAKDGCVVLKDFVPPSMLATARSGDRTAVALCPYQRDGDQPV